MNSSKGKELFLTVICIAIFIAAFNFGFAKDLFASKPGALRIITHRNKSYDVNATKFESYNPEYMDVTITKNNGEKIRVTYYAVPMEQVVVHNIFNSVKVVASDDFSATYALDELEDNVYISYDKDKNEYSAFALKDEDGERAVQGIQTIYLMD